MFAARCPSGEMVDAVDSKEIQNRELKIKTLQNQR
jgi:hypothetical protein